MHELTRIFLVLRRPISIFLFFTICLFFSASSIADTRQHSCEIPKEVLNSKSQVEKVTLLSEKASDLFKNNDQTCAVSLLEKASQEINKIKSGEDRTIAGYEIKEVVFKVIQQQKVTDDDGLRKLVSLAIQSLTHTGETSNQATTAERINDASFLFRVSKQFKKDNIAENISVEYFLLMLRIGNTLENQKRPYVDYDIIVYCEYLLEHSAFADIVKVIKEIQENDIRMSVINSLQHKLTYDLGYASKKNKLLNTYMGNYLKSDRCKDCKPYKTNYSPAELFDKETTLRYADEAEKLMTFMDSESMTQRISTQSLPKKGGDSAPMWKFKIQQFIWRSYLVAGPPENMKEKIRAWISSIRDLKNRAQKVSALMNVAEDIYRADVDYKLALELLGEAEGEAQLIEDNKTRLSWLESIANRKKWMK
jgi:hypothetical protein